MLAQVQEQCSPFICNGLCCACTGVTAFTAESSSALVSTVPVGSCKITLASGVAAKCNTPLLAARTYAYLDAEFYAVLVTNRTVCMDNSLFMYADKIVAHRVPHEEPRMSATKLPTLNGARNTSHRLRLILLCRAKM